MGASTLLNEFRQFAMRGNIVDLALGVILGTAFNGIILSLVSDIITPPIGLLLNGINFSDLYVTLSGTEYASLEAAKAAGAITINYGVFLNNLISFIIMAFVLFLVVRQVNRIHLLKQQEPSATATTRECPFCCSTIPLKALRCPQCTSELPKLPQIVEV